MESVVRFENPAGLALQGILHRPERADANTPAVVWLSAGQKVRQGAWRMNVVMARRLAAQGIPVLRFDYHGMGDSEGERHHGQFVMDFYGFVQTGGFRDDVVAAVEFLLREVGARPVVLAGLCGGAASALFAGPQLGRRVAGHVLVDLPVTISSSARQRYLEAHPEALVRARPAEADTVLALYAKKLLDVDAWRRLARGESTPKLLLEALRVKARLRVDPWVPHLPDAARALVDRALGAAPVAPVDGDPDETARGEVRNELVGPAFRAVLAAGQRVRFVNSSTYDPVFQTYFAAHELPASGALPPGVERAVVPDSNHIFSLEHAQQQLFASLDGAVREATRVAKAA